MLLVDIKNVSKYINSEALLEDISLQIHSGDRIGLVGKNGSGKSTLVRMIMGLDKDYTGQINALVPVSYIEQLGFEDSGYKSGGEFTRKKIYNAVRENSSLLIADEPTCNLDLSSIKQLERQLKSVESLLIISHDQYLLEAVCSKIIEIDNHHLTVYNTTYGEYIEAKRRKAIDNQRRYDNYLNSKRQIEKSISKTNKKASSVKDAKKKHNFGNSEARLHKRKAGERRAKIEANASAIQSRLDMLEKVDKPYEYKEVSIKVPDKLTLHTPLLVDGTEFDVAFGRNQLFKGATFRILNKDKLWLQGDNGSGKSTLIKMIINGDNRFNYAKKLKIGYFDQKLEQLNFEKNIFDNILEASSRSANDVHHILANLLFKGNDIYKKTGVLSGGELVKATFAKVLLSDINLLILDEPTNYLDIETKKHMMEALSVYEGTMLLVTHDRSFGEGVSTSVKTIKKGLIL